MYMLETKWNKTAVRLVFGIWRDIKIVCCGAVLHKFNISYDMAHDDDDDDDEGNGRKEETILEEEKWEKKINI